MGRSPVGWGQTGLKAAPLGPTGMSAGDWGAQAQGAEASVGPGLGDGHLLPALAATPSSTHLPNLPPPLQKTAFN